MLSHVSESPHDKPNLESIHLHAIKDEVEVDEKSYLETDEEEEDEESGEDMTSLK